VLGVLWVLGEGILVMMGMVMMCGRETGAGLHNRAWGEGIRCSECGVGESEGDVGRLLRFQELLAPLGRDGARQPGGKKAL
jgi:hypothetical protein